MIDHPSRQSFLGEHSDDLLRATTVGIVGLSGGGSHVCQQLAHIGVGSYVLVDPEVIEDTNLNRLVGGTVADVVARTPKVGIAERMIRAVRPEARIVGTQDDWRNASVALRDCEVVFGCVDTYRDRNELERQVRRYMTPYIDIGMDVGLADNGYHISGQAALSIPGGACLWCMGILRQGLLAEEAADYGHAGIRQQVVWPNGVLASSAVGMFMSLILPWAPRLMVPLLEYDGNRGTVVPSLRLNYMPAACPHFRDETDLGDPFWTMLKESAELLGTASRHRKGRERVDNQ
jgi:molybdopterin-synthase adenylyltransferase